MLASNVINSGSALITSLKLTLLKEIEHIEHIRLGQRAQHRDLDAHVHFARDD